MIMVKRSSARVIKVSGESTKKLAELFGCSDRMVYKALCFECDTPLARRIRSVARCDMGGWIEASVAEEEIFYDTVEDGGRFLRQYFGNGAVLEINMTTGDGAVWFRGQLMKRYPDSPLKLVPVMQDYARGLRFKN